MAVRTIDLVQSALTTTGKSIMINDVPAVSLVIIYVSFQYIKLRLSLVFSTNITVVAAQTEMNCQYQSDRHFNLSDLTRIIT